MSAAETGGDETVFAATAHRNESMARLLLIEDDRETADEIRAELGERGIDTLTGPQTAAPGSLSEPCVGCVM
jgi:hypothetical protein